MVYFIGVFILAAGYYTLSYARHLWKIENNRLGAVGSALIAITATVSSIIALWITQ